MNRERGIRFELVNCEGTILREIADKTLKQRDIAQTYALTLRSIESEVVNWSKINQAIIERWSLSGLMRIKTLAWTGKCFE